MTAHDLLWKQAWARIEPANRFRVVDLSTSGIDSNRKLVEAGDAQTGIGDRNLYSLFVAHKQLRRAVVAFTRVPTGVFVDRVGMIEVNSKLCMVGVINPV